MILMRSDISESSKIGVVRIRDGGMIPRSNTKENMKKFFLKTLSAFLAVAAVLLSMGFVGCAKGGDVLPGEETGGEWPEGGSGSVSSGNAVFPYLTTNLEKQKFNRTICQLYRGPDQEMSHEIYIKDGEKSGDKIDYAVFRKNSEVEDYLGIKFDFHPEDGSAHGYELVNKLEAAVKSGDNTYQIVSNSNYGTISSMLTGSFLNLKHVGNLDLTQKYWAQYVNDNAEITGALFGVTGSLSLYLYQELFVCFVNKTLCQKRRIQPEALYQTVLDGDWTLDYMINLTKDIYENTNGNDSADLGDLYGFAMQLSSSTDGYWSSCDIRLADADPATGKLVVDNIDLAKLGVVVKKLNSFVWNQPGVLRIVEDDNYQNLPRKIYYKLGSTLIAQDQVLFANDRLYEVCNEDMKNCDHYGVLPYPKYNSGQKQYYSYVHDAYTVFMIAFPAKQEADICGATLECLAYFGHNTVMPVYYEEVLTSRYVRDPESVEMLNLIFQNIRMDAGLVFGPSMIQIKLLRNLVFNERNSVASEYRNEQRAANAECNRISQAYAKYVNN